LRTPKLAADRPVARLQYVIVSRNSKKPTGIKAIAGALGISIGTVDRALHNRPGISAKTRVQVLNMAEKLAYQPNLAARNLKLNRHLRIGVFLPQEIASFFDPLCEGVRSTAADTHGLDVGVEIFRYPRIGKGDVELLESKIKESYDGLILTPGNSSQFVPLLMRIAQKRTPVVFVGSDLPRAERVSSVTIDATVSGGIAAELFSRTISKEGSVAVITGNLDTQDHAEKLRGFAATLALIAPHLRLKPTIETHERPKEAFDATLKLIGRRPPPEGIYINTANSLPVLRALEESKLLGQIQIITTDLYAELVPFIEKGEVLASLYQRPYTQGKTAFEVLVRFLTQQITPEQATRLAPHIILRSNLSLFTKNLHESEEHTRR
jgi:LacI family transcriptional regulator